MDGNGRWAKERGKLRTEGHKEGLVTAKKIVRKAKDLGLKYLSLYTFSTENWKRAKEEVNFLMVLIRDHLEREFDFYRECGIRIVHSGDLQALPSDVQKSILKIVHDTKDFTSLTVNLAINYGGRDEIVRAVNKMMQEGIKAIDSESLSAHMDVPCLSDPDLIIRTSGDIRLSNFLLWQSAYSELYFSEKLWPDFTENDLELAIQEFQNRERRYGGAK